MSGCLVVWYIWDEIAFNNYIDLCIIIIETLPLFPSYITYQLYKYILWTWTNLSYYINTFIAHYCIRLYNVYTSIYIWCMYIQPWQKLLNHLWRFVNIDLNIQSSLFTENKHTCTMLLLSIICQHNSQSIMNIIYNTIILCLFGFTKKS